MADLDECSRLLSTQDIEKNINAAIVEKTDESISTDVMDTLHLAMPIFLSRISYTGMKTVDTALLGHVSGAALSAAALSDICTACP